MTRAQQVEILAAGVLFDGVTIANPYAAFYAAGTTTAKNAYADAEKAVAITKKALDSQGRAVVYGDGTYKIRIYSGDPDNGGVLKFEIDNYKVSSVAGNARTITSNTTGTEDDGLILVNTAGGNVVYTLPAAGPMIGRTLTVKKVISANTLTYAAASGENIDGYPSASLSDLNATVQLISDGTNWYGAQIVGTAETLGGYAVSATAVAGTIPVYDGSATIPGTATTAQGTKADNALPAATYASDYTAANVLTKLLTVDGPTSGISAQTAASATTAGTCTGNAATSTKLATPRAINGVDFDGSAPITITLTTAQVLAATAAATTGAVGTYALAINSGAAAVALGATVAGSTLYIYTSTGGGNLTVTNSSSTFPTAGLTVQSGTWRALAGIQGRADTGGGTYTWYGTLFLRIS